MVVGGSTRNEVRGNETFRNAQGFERAAPGIRIYQSPGNIVDNNITHDNEDSGIESYPGANNTLIYNNVSYSNGDHGIDDLRTTGQRIIGNTVYNNVTAGINLEGNSTGGTIKNNICVDNGIKSPRTHSDIRIESGSTAGTTVDYNVGLPDDTGHALDLELGQLQQRSPLSRRRAGRCATASTPTRGGATSARATSTSPPALRRSTRPDSATSGQPGPGRRGVILGSTTRPRRTRASALAPTTIAGAYEFQPSSRRPAPVGVR